MVGRSVIAVACASLAFAATAGASDYQSDSSSKVTAGSVYVGKYRVVKDGKYIIYTQTTSSRIPERVVVRGQQANTASPMYVVQGNGEILRTGATTLAGILALDPSITSKVRD
jgi:hypothetical protein